MVLTPTSLVLKYLVLKQGSVSSKGLDKFLWNLDVDAMKIKL